MMIAKMSEVVNAARGMEDKRCPRSEVAARQGFRKEFEIIIVVLAFKKSGALVINGILQTLFHVSRQVKTELLPDFIPVQQ